jgi:hypothetical protein
LDSSLFTHTPARGARVSATEYRAAIAKYDDFLRASDLAQAGDLLRYFGSDFFHDGLIRRPRFGVGSRSFSFEAECAYVDAGDPDDNRRPYPRFHVRFDGVVGLDWRRVGPSNQRIYIHSEIDGRLDLVEQAHAQFGGAFHSLAIDAYGESLVLVFRSVSVTPRDSQRWSEILADPSMRVLGLFE